ncbi:MAG: methionyl-tRNA formyltransferase [Chlamydiia bacterium]|nr:methionyl-tRNA formyltransferase [Chlamydiia bacterium]
MLKVVFFGTPDFAAETLRFLLEQGVHVAAVVSKPDRPKGRSGAPAPTAVKQLLLQSYPDLPLHQPEKASAPEFAEVLAQYDADLFIVVAYGEIMRQNLLDMPKLACINVHASLLPEYRGAAPIQRAIMDGKKETGISIMHMVRKLDAGDVIRQVIVPIGTNTTFGELHDALCVAGSAALLQVIQAFEQGSVNSIPQDESLVTYAHKIELEDCELDWSKPAQVLHDLVRGVNPFPIAWAWVKVRGAVKRLKVLSTRVRTDLHGAPGAIASYTKAGIVVACGAGGLELVEVQLEGKRRMLGQDFVLGTPQDQLEVVIPDDDGI